MTWWNDYQKRRGTSSRKYNINNIQRDIINSFDDLSSYKIKFWKHSGIDESKSRYVRVIDKEFNEKKMLGCPNDVYNVGDCIVFLKEDTDSDEISDILSSQWLITSKDDNNIIQEKCYITKCNNILHIQTGETRTIIGHDNIGRPIIDTIPNYLDLPCITSKKSIQESVEDNNPINLPEGKMFVTIPYSNLIKEGMEFDMYNTGWRILINDMTKTEGSKGIIILTVERKVGD